MRYCDMSCKLYYSYSKKKTRPCGSPFLVRDFPVATRALQVALQPQDVGSAGAAGNSDALHVHVLSRMTAHPG